jgi:hypothetical protein
VWGQPVQRCNTVIIRLNSASQYYLASCLLKFIIVESTAILQNHGFLFQNKEMNLLPSNIFQEIEISGI